MTDKCQLAINYFLFDRNCTIEKKNFSDTRWLLEIAIKEKCLNCVTNDTDNARNLWFIFINQSELMGKSI